MMIMMIYIYIYIYIYKPKSIFKCSLAASNLEVFLLIDRFKYHGLRIQSILQFTYTWRANRWIQTFHKGISPMLNANSLAIVIY